MAVAARRARAGHGAGNPSAASRASVRTAESTSARSTGVGGGSEVRASSRCARSSPSRRSGSGRSRRTQAIHGSRPPTRRDASVRALDRAHDGRQTGGVRERGDELLAVTSPDAGATARPAAAARRRGRRAPTSASNRANTACRPRTRASTVLRNASVPSPVRADSASTGMSSRPSGASTRSRSLRARSTWSPSRSAWLSTTSIARRVPGQGTQIAVVQRGVGVLLRVHDPHEQVDELDEAVDLVAVGRLDRVEVREVEQDEARRRTRVEGVAAADPEPVQQRGRHRFAHRGGRTSTSSVGARRS